MKNPRWVGFDLGGTKMLAQIYNGDLKKLSSAKNPTEGHKGADSGLKRIIKTLSEALDKADLKPSDLAGIGIACPGPVDPHDGVLIEAPNLGWKNTPISKTLEKEFGCPIVLANDVDAGVYGEHTHGAAMGVRCAVGIFPGTGIGGGAVLDDIIVQGEHTSAMEIGHLPVIRGGPLCGCGNRGCLETVASRLAIASDIIAAAYRGQAPHILETCGTDIIRVKSGKIAAAIEAGDTVVEEIVREAARWLGHGVSTIVHLLAPELIVLGGGLVEAMPDLWCEEVYKSAKNRVLPTYRKSFKVVPAKLGDDAGTLGAASWARHELSS